MSSKTPPRHTARQLVLFRYRSRLFATSTFALLAFIALLLVNVRNPKNPVDTAIWQFFVNIRMGWFDRVVEIFYELIQHYSRYYLRFDSSNIFLMETTRWLGLSDCCSFYD